jgi:CubicO group peptidase (beta-lactamase class C family)
MTASLIIGRQTGKSWLDIVRDDILLPAGTTNTGHNDATAYADGQEPKNYVHSDTGTFIDAPMFFPPVLATGAGYNTSARDLSRIFLAINAHKILSPELLARYEFDPKHMFHTGGGAYYSLASEVTRIGHFRTMGHSGGPDLADIRYSPDKQVGVAVLANRNNTGISAQLTDRILRRVLLDSAFKEQKRPIGIAIRGMVRKSSDEELAMYYERNRHNPRYHYVDAERDLNRAGYELLGSADIPDALKIFRLIAKVFPESGNAFDSLGEAYLKAGDKQRALANYKKAYALSPDNAHAKEIIDELSGHE